MKGLNSESIESLERMIKLKFDDISMRFIGIIPRINKNKHIVFKTSKDNLMSIFLQALGDRNPNRLEERTLKTLLSIANGYVDALRDRTSVRIVNDIDSYIKNSSSKKKAVSTKQIDSIIEKELDKAGKHLKLIATAESNKASNIGTALQISKMGKEKKEEDPTVFFVVTIDDVTGSEEFKLHLMPDRRTPRVWRLSEIGHEYHKRGDTNPKFPGLHPNCRCKLTYLAKGWGFDASGKIKYIGPNWDQLAHQRKVS